MKIYIGEEWAQMLPIQVRALGHFATLVPDVLQPRAA